MTPCENIIKLENMQQAIINLEKHFERLDSKQTSTDKSIERLEKQLESINVSMQKAQNWLIWLLIGIIGTLLSVLGTFVYNLIQK